jgi:hypothetical protein
MYGFRVAEVPVPVRYEAQSSSVNVPGLFAYAGRTVHAALKRPPWKKKKFGTGGSMPPPPPPPSSPSGRSNTNGKAASTKLEDLPRGESQTRDSVERTK